MALNRIQTQQNADKLLRQGRLKESLAQYLKLLEETPQDVSLLNQVGDLHQRLGQPERALTFFTRIAEHYRDRGFAQKAIAMFKKIVRLKGSSWEPREQLAALYAEQGLVREAEAFLREAAALASEQGRADKALELEGRALEMRPDDGAGLKRLAERLAAAGDTPRSLSTYLRAAEVFGRGQSVEAALGCFREALGLSPESREAAAAMSRLLREAGRGPDLIREIEAVLAKAPGELHLRVVLAESHLMYGDLAAASKALGKEPAGAQDDPFYLGIQARVMLGEGKRDPGLAVLHKAVKRHDDLGQSPLALELLRAALEASRNDGEVLEALHRRSLSGEPARPETVTALQAVAAALSAAGRQQDLGPVLLHLWRARPGDAEVLEELRRLGIDPATARQGTTKTVRPSRIQMSATAAEEADPEFIAEHLTEADVFIKYRLLPKAAAHLKSIVQRFPLTVVAHQRLIEVYIEMGERRGAVEQHVSLAEAFRLRGAPAESEGALQAALNYEPSSGLIKLAREALKRGEPLPVPGESEADPEPPTPPPPPVARAEPPAQPPARPRPVDEILEFDEEPEDTAAAAPAEPPPPAAARRRGKPAPAAPTPPRPPQAAPPAADFDGFDLAQAIESELAAELPAGDDSTIVNDGADAKDDPIGGIRKALQNQVEEEDFQTQYQLGIAFREMGMLDQAIGAFQQASRSPDHFLSCCSMLGLCFREKGMPQIAEKWYQRGLERAAGDPETLPFRLGLLYDLGELCMKIGDQARAREYFTEVYASDASYRDVSRWINEAAAPPTQTR